MLIVVTKA